MTNEEMRASIQGEVSRMHEYADQLTKFAETLKRTATNDVSFASLEECKKVAMTSVSIRATTKKVLAMLKKRGKTMMQEISR